MNRYGEMPTEVPKKVCSVCKEEKIIHEFNKYRNGKPGRRCKPCIKANTKDTEYSVLAKYQPDPRFERRKKSSNW